MRMSKILKKLAKKEKVPLEKLRSEIQVAMDLADWSAVSPNGTKPATIEEGLHRIATHENIKKQKI